MRLTGCGGRGVSRKPPWLYTAEVEEDAEPAAALFAASGRKKAAAIGVRMWLAVNTAGEARKVEAGKHAIMRRTGLPSRDLRILDPQLSYPSTVLGRERAIVINLEHIKAVITAHEVLILNSRDPAVAPFIHRLQRRLHHHHLRQRPQEEDGAGSSDEGHAYVLEEVRSSSEYYGNVVNYSGAIEDQTEGDEKSKPQEAADIANSYNSNVLPFEFIALEACLEAACSCLENEATCIESEAHPALDKLTSKISTLNLEHVRQIKSRLVAITGRVQKVRDELEHLLDDDEDMAEMYLTDKLLQQRQSTGSPQSSQMGQSGSFNEERIPAELSSDKNDIQHNYDANNLVFGSSMILEDGHESHTHTFSTRSSFKHLYVEELEMLLEAYFVQIDSTLNKLSTLREYVDDTEDYINIMLDDKQNHLLQMGVVLTTSTLIVSAFVVLVGIFGMNIKVDLFDENKTGTPMFLWTVGGGATGCLLLYLVSVTWCKRKGLLE